MTNMKIDTHQHFWNLAKVEYPWLTPAAGPLYRTHEPSELAPQIRAAGIDRTVLVQSANNTEDTISMLTQAEDYSWIGGVVGWVPLLDPDMTGRLLERYSRHPKYRGMRHLIHNEADPDWIAQERVIQGLKVLAGFGMVFDLVPVYPNHLKHAPMLAERLPNLTIVIDHLAVPPIRDRQMGEWAAQMAAAARYPNVFAKVSGLVTAADRAGWSAEDLRPYIDFAIEKFGADRLMFGSDWPVCTLAAAYAQWWGAINNILARYSAREVDAILGGTAARVYRISD
jgi:L-fuconolactonase